MVCFCPKLGCHIRLVAIESKQQEDVVMGRRQHIAFWYVIVLILCLFVSIVLSLDAAAQAVGGCLCIVFLRGTRDVGSMLD